ncbi:MAG: hypothetical protein H6585_15525 [Flavobacteriales bacterium]|nr:hypothetical protein [Flavobacteriales bacterium]MCB9449741.1 hypothetical protein [Flavobacteriales bacterium]
MAIDIKVVQSAADIKQFCDLPFELYRGNKFWVPPVKADERKALDPKLNPAFGFCDAKFFLAFRNGKCVGRTGAIINKAYNEKTGKRYGRINRIEFIDDTEVSKALLDACFNWFREENMELVHGPLGFTNLDTQGLLIEGFDHLPSIASVYHLPYYQQHFDQYGFEKENDWVEFRLTLSEIAVKKGLRGGEIVKKRYGFEVVNFSTRAELEAYGDRIFEVFNDAFQFLPYVNALNADMIQLYKDKYFKVLNPRFIKVVKKGDEVVGFFVGLPSLSEAMQKAGGKLFPFGFTYVLKALKKPKVIDMLLTGVKQEYQSAGVAVILIGELQNEMLKAGINTMETTGIFESNGNVISNWKNYDHIQHKRRRCYVKPL